MKNTIQETVKEVYKINKNNDVKFNKNIYDFERDFPRSVPRNNVNKNTNVTLPSLPPPTSFSINPFLIVLLLLIILSIAIIVFQEKIRDFFMKYFKDDTLEKEKKNLESKVTEEKEKTQALEQELKELKKKKEKTIVEEKTTEPSKASNDDKIKQSYSKTQMVNEDGYCYIGTDDNMRHCVNAYVGDVCTSSDVYKKMDDCLMPKSSSEEACYL